MFRNYKNKIISGLSGWGLDWVKLRRRLDETGQFKSDLKQFKQQEKEHGSHFSLVTMRPVFGERTQSAGTMRGHYFHQDLYVAQKIYSKNPVKHVDIGSRIDGFIAHLAVFRSVELIDIRAQDSEVKNINFIQADLMQLPEGQKESCDSISSLHAIEHFGLGRYGDPIDYLGHLKALDNIHIMLKRGGTFYFSTPIGPHRVEFNAHRVFSLEYLLKVFANKFKVIDFAYVNDEGLLFRDVELYAENIVSNCGCEYGCGIFTLEKI